MAAKMVDNMFKLKIDPELLVFYYVFNAGLYSTIFQILSVWNIGHILYGFWDHTTYNSQSWL